LKFDIEFTAYTHLIILDANFILLPYQFKIDYFREIDQQLGGKLLFIIFQQVYDELDAKMEREPQASKFKRHYTGGLQYIEKFKDTYEVCELPITKRPEETTDAFLLRIAIALNSKSPHLFLATNDADLRKKAKQAHINVIFLRQRKFLSFE